MARAGTGAVGEEARDRIAGHLDRGRSQPARRRRRAIPGERREVQAVKSAHFGATKEPLSPIAVMCVTLRTSGAHGQRA